MKIAKLLFNFSFRKASVQVSSKNRVNQIKFSSFPTSLNYCPKHHFSSTQQFQQVFNKDSEIQLHKLQQEYRATQNVSIFEPTIKNSTSLLDQMTIFKIFKVMQGSPYNNVAYNNFFQAVNQTIKRRSDNILLLLASIKRRIADYHKKQNQNGEAIKCFEEALDILENSMVPPLLPYYSIYREYGILYDFLGQHAKAKEILTQAVDILDDFVSHSDDNVSTNDYCKKQATAYNVLARVDPENSKKWIEKANQSWKAFAQQSFKQVEYAKTVALNLKNLLKQDKEKGESYYHFNLYKFQSKELKDIVKKAKQQAGL